MSKERLEFQGQRFSTFQKQEDQKVFSIFYFLKEMWTSTIVYNEKESTWKSGWDSVEREVSGFVNQTLRSWAVRVLWVGYRTMVAVYHKMAQRAGKWNGWSAWSIQCNQQWGTWRNRTAWSRSLCPSLIHPAWLKTLQMSRALAKRGCEYKTSPINLQGNIRPRPKPKSNQTKTIVWIAILLEVV